MDRGHIRAFWSFVALLMLGSGIAQAQDRAPMAGSVDRPIRIGMVARGDGNETSMAARTGALREARELSLRYGIEIRIDWRTPAADDAGRQADAIDAMVRDREDGILISCSDSGRLVGPINNAVRQGIPVVTFDADCPDSQRFASYGTNEFELGRSLMANLARTMGDRGGFAILAGDRRIAAFQDRIRGIRDELSHHPGMNELALVEHQMAPDSAVRAIDDEMFRDGRRVEGWILTNSWPLVTANAFRWAPGTVKVVGADAPRAALNYVKAGYVQVLIAPDYAAWGRRSVEVIADKILFGKNPDSPNLPALLQLITPQNVQLLSGMWDEWAVRHDDDRPVGPAPIGNPPPPVVVGPPPVVVGPPPVVVGPPEIRPPEHGRRVDTHALIEDGQRFQKNREYDRAMELYKQAADAGDPAAMYYAGMLYQAGLGVRQDSVEAMRWFNRGSGEGGNPEAMYMAGYGYENGRGVPKDMPKAIALYRRAAAGGSPEARQWMAEHRMN